MAQALGAEEMESRQCSDALDGEGYVLGYPDANGIVAKVAAGGKVYGVAYMSTKDQTGTAIANKQVAIIRKPKIAYVRYNNGGGETIAIGDIVSSKGANAAGTCKKLATTAWPGTWSNTDAETICDEYALIVGIALEAKSASTSGLLKCQLLCPLPTKQ